MLDLSRLPGSMDHARHFMQKPRANRLHLLKRIAGPRYARGPDIDPDEDILVNYLKRHHTVYRRLLASREPKCMVRTAVRDAMPLALERQVAINYAIGAMGLRWVIRDAVGEAMVGLGVVKLTIDDEASPLGIVADSIDLDDFLFDVHPGDLYKASWYAHTYLVPEETFKASTDLYDQKVVRKVKPYTPNENGEYDADEPARDNITGYAADSEPFYSSYKLWDVWFPHHNRFVTLAEGMWTTPLRDVEWKGPPRGPFHFLGYEWLPTEPMPIPPLLDQAPLDDRLNNLMAKIVAQAEQQKQFYVYTGDDTVADTIRRAKNGDVVAIGGAADVPEQRMLGGPDQGVFLLTRDLSRILNVQAGNIDILAGAGGNADTLGQEQMMASGAAGLVSDMRGAVGDFTKGLCEDILFWMVRDSKTHPMRATDDRSGVEFGFQFPSERQRAANDTDFMFDIDVYTMADTSPVQQAQKLYNFINTAAVLAPFMQQQGVSIDTRALVSAIAQFEDLPSLLAVVREAESAEFDLDPHVRTKPPVTKRIEERRSKSSPNPRAAEQAVDAELISGMNSAGGGY